MAKWLGAQALDSTASVLSVLWACNPVRRGHPVGIIGLNSILGLHLQDAPAPQLHCDNQMSLDVGDGSWWEPLPESPAARAQSEAASSQCGPSEF